MSATILELIYSAIDQVNAQSDGGKPIPKGPDTTLMGGDDAIDSLAFVNLIMALENEIQEKYGKAVVLVTESTLESGEHPFRTAGTLAAYIERLLGA